MKRGVLVLGFMACGSSDADPVTALVEAAGGHAPGAKAAVLPIVPAPSELAGIPVGFEEPRRGGCFSGGELLQGSAPPPASPRVTKHRALDATSLRSDVVAAKIDAAYRGGVLDCQPLAGGQPVMSLTVKVDEVGRTFPSRVWPTGDAFTACIVAAVSTWRFPVAKNPDGEPTTARFAISLAFEKP